MKISETVNSNNYLLSLEVIPPNRGEDKTKLFKSLESLIEYNPSFINITNHPTEVKYYENNDNNIDKIVTGRSGTIGLSHAIRNTFGVEPVPHILTGTTKIHEMEDLLIDLHFMNIKNVFLVRGDSYNKNNKNILSYIDDIDNMNSGNKFKSLKTDFDIGVACYPEKHFESFNINYDLLNLRKKAQYGASYAITQMFFDSKHYIDFVTRARKLNITIPIIPGIKPITSFKSLQQIPGRFHIDIPNKLLDMSYAQSSKEEFNYGINHTAKMIEELIEFGIPGIHLFTMGRHKASKALLERIK